MKKSSQQEINLLCERYPQLLPLKETLLQVVERIAMAYQEGHTLLICGNGGSASDSLHITGELMKSFSFRRPISNELAQTLRESYPQNAEFYIQTLEGALPTIFFGE